MTTDHQTAAAPPAWMLLDAYCPAEIRRDRLVAATDRLVAATDRLAELTKPGSTFEEACHAAYRAARAYMDATDRAAADVDDPTETFGPFTGWARFAEVLWQVDVLVGCASGDVGMGSLSDPGPFLPDWYRPVPTADVPVSGADLADDATLALIVLGRPMDKLVEWTARQDPEALQSAILTIMRWSTEGVPEGWEPAIGGEWSLSVAEDQGGVVLHALPVT